MNGLVRMLVNAGLPYELAMIIFGYLPVKRRLHVSSNSPLQLSALSGAKPYSYNRSAQRHRQGWEGWGWGSLGVTRGELQDF